MACSGMSLDKTCRYHKPHKWPKSVMEICAFSDDNTCLQSLHSCPNLLYVTYIHDVLYVCATSILFLFSQRDHNENKVYPDLYYAIPATVS